MAFHDIHTKEIPGSARENETVFVRTQLITGRNEPKCRVDIRKYIYSSSDEGYEGWTREGASLTIPQAEKLLAALPAAISAAKKTTNTPNVTKAKALATKG